MLHPARSRIGLRKFTLRCREQPCRRIEEEASRRGRALVDREEMAHAAVSSRPRVSRGGTLEPHYIMNVTHGPCSAIGSIFLKQRKGPAWRSLFGDRDGTSLCKLSAFPGAFGAPGIHKICLCSFIGQGQEGPGCLQAARLRVLEGRASGLSGWSERPASFRPGWLPFCHQGSDVTAA
jgi:hypothetical protein